MTDLQQAVEEYLVSVRPQTSWLHLHLGTHFALQLSTDRWCGAF